MQQRGAGSALKSQAMTTKEQCGLCHGEFVVERPPGSGRYGPCPCVRERQKLAQFEAIMSRADALPEQTFESFRAITKAQIDALEDARTEHRGFYFYGPKGTGKSHLMNATVLRAADRRIPSVMVSVPKLLYLLRSDRNKDLMHQAMHIPYLALDDIGKQYAGKQYNWVDEWLYTLIDERYRLWQRGVAVTSFTSQCQLNSREQEDGLENIMDPAIVDRIRHMCLTVRLDGESFRKAGR